MKNQPHFHFSSWRERKLCESLFCLIISYVKKYTILYKNVLFPLLWKIKESYETLYFISMSNMVFSKRRKIREVSLPFLLCCLFEGVLRPPLNNFPCCQSKFSKFEKHSNNFVHSESSCVDKGCSYYLQNINISLIVINHEIGIPTPLK